MRVRREGHAYRHRRPARDSLRRGIYLLPSLFTVGNMLCGFAAVLYTLHDRLEYAAWLILLAGLLDGLDGRIARLTRSTSEFGNQIIKNFICCTFKEQSVVTIGIEVQL